MADLILTDSGRPFLYLGDANAATNPIFLKEKNIKYIVNCTKDIPILSGVAYVRLPVDDLSNESISTFFDTANKFIERARQKSDGAVLVHCAAGISRSATVTTSYLISRGMSLDGALSYLIGKRPQVHPNKGFFSQLQDVSGSKFSYTDFTFMRQRMLFA